MEQGLWSPLSFWLFRVPEGICLTFYDQVQLTHLRTPVFLSLGRWDTGLGGHQPSMAGGRYVRCQQPRKQLLTDVGFSDQNWSHSQPSWDFLTFFYSAPHVYLHSIICANCWFMLFSISPPSFTSPTKLMKLMRKYKSFQTQTNGRFVGQMENWKRVTKGGGCGQLGRISSVGNSRPRSEPRSLFLCFTPRICKWSYS